MNDSFQKVEDDRRSQQSTQLTSEQAVSHTQLLSLPITSRVANTISESEVIILAPTGACISPLVL